MKKSFAANCADLIADRNDFRQSSDRRSRNEVRHLKKRATRRNRAAGKALARLDY